MTTAPSGPAEGRLVTLERPADLTTPVALMRRLLRSPAPCFLLESVEAGERLGRWSFLGTGPSREISGAVEDPFAALKKVARGARATEDGDGPPFTGGAVGYLGWEAVRRLERLPTDKPDPIGLPDAWFGIFEEVIAFDHARHRLVFVAHDDGDAGGARARLERLADSLLSGDAGHVPSEPPRAGAWEESLPRARYVSVVEKAKEHVRAGDVFQVVPSRRWSASFAGDPFAVYRALRRVNPSPYQYYLRTPEAVVFGASPERLVRVHGGTVETHPLAGTRPRGATPAEDRRLEAELLADEKERAEHLMLVDLGRNDLGRVAAPGTVSVPEFFTVTRASHVMHIASRVAARLGEGRDAVDALAATFPAGTLSGAPKIRAMQAIDDLEPVRRGIFGGAVGYLDFAGNLDVAIAIRTAVVANGRIHLQAGAGIVADSVPEREADECENKARALMRALAEAKEYA